MSGRRLVHARCVEFYSRRATTSDRPYNFPNEFMENKTYTLTGATDLVTNVSVGNTRNGRQTKPLLNSNKYVSIPNR